MRIGWTFYREETALSPEAADDRHLTTGKPHRFLLPLEARLWPSGGLAECVGDGVAEGRSEFPHVGRVAGCDKTLFAPDLAAHGGESIGECRELLATPSAGGCGLAGPGWKLSAEQEHKREQPEQAGNGARDGLV